MSGEDTGKLFIAIAIVIWILFSLLCDAVYAFLPTSPRGRLIAWFYNTGLWNQERSGKSGVRISDMLFGGPTARMILGTVFGSIGIVFIVASLIFNGTIDTNLVYLLATLFVFGCVQSIVYIKGRSKRWGSAGSISILTFLILPIILIIVAVIVAYVNQA